MSERVLDLHHLVSFHLLCLNLLGHGCSGKNESEDCLLTIWSLHSAFKHVNVPSSILDNWPPKRSEAVDGEVLKGPRWLK